MISLKTAVLLAVLLLSVNIVSSFDEAELLIEVDYFGNFTPLGEDLSDMSDFIFVGDNPEPVGRDGVTVFLTEMGEGIVDGACFRDVPGLHVFRGKNEEGYYFDITAFGFNSEDSRETVVFNIELKNAVIESFENGPEDFLGYANPSDGICNYFEGEPERDEVRNDEYDIELGGKRAEFCSITSTGEDVVRIFYSYNDETAPKIENIVIEPELPLTNKGREETLAIDFTSSEYPINVVFKLLRGGEVVKFEGPVFVENESALPLSFVIPANLEENLYVLKMIAGDEAGNEVEITLGEIEVVKKEDDGDGDGGGGRRNNRRNNFEIIESIKPQDEGREVVRGVSIGAEPILLDSSSQKGKIGLMLSINFWILSLIVLIILLIIGIVVAMFI